MKNSFLGAMIGGPVFLLIGYFVAFHVGKPILDDARASAAWPSVDGVVERSEVTTHRGHEKQTMYSPEVAYRYNVDGKDFQGSMVAFGGDFSSNNSSHAYAVTEQYPVGKEVSVYYEPDAPGHAVLEPGVTWKSYLAFGIGLAFLAAGVLMLATPLCYIAIGSLIVGGAASGAVGRRKGRPQIDHVGPPVGAATRDAAAPPMATGADDGFDVG